MGGLTLVKQSSWKEEVYTWFTLTAMTCWLYRRAHITGHIDTRLSSTGRTGAETLCHFSSFDVWKWQQVGNILIVWIMHQAQVLNVPSFQLLTWGLAAQSYVVNGKSSGLRTKQNIQREGKDNVLHFRELIELSRGKRFDLWNKWY